MNIVGDRLSESRRLLFAPEVSAEGDLYENIERSLLAGMPSPLQEAFAKILSEDRDEIIQKQVQASSSSPRNTASRMVICSQHTNGYWTR